MKYVTTSYVQKCLFFINLRWFISVIIYEYTAQEHTEEECIYFKERLVDTDSNSISLCTRIQRLDLLIGYLSIPPSVQS